MTVDEYRVASTLLWRPEGWLWAKVFDLASEKAPLPPDNTVFPSLLFAGYFIMFDPTCRSCPDWWRSVYNWEDLLLFTANFSLSTWVSSAASDSASRYMGIKWTGTRAALGNDFSATGRLEECKVPHSTGGGLVRIDITCSGEACANFLRFSTMCTSEGATCPASIGVPVICKPMFSVLWDRDRVAEQLWGSRKREVPWREYDQKLWRYLNGDWGNAPNFAQTSRCPVLERAGQARLSTKLTDTFPLLYQGATEVFAAAKDGDCQYCAQDDCSGGCKWDPSGKCVSATVTSTRPLWCFLDAWTEDNLMPTYSSARVRIDSVQRGGSLRPVCPLYQAWYPCYTVFDLRAQESELVPKADMVAPQVTRCRRTMTPTGAPSEAPTSAPPSEGPTSSPSTPPTTGIPTTAPSAGPSSSPATHGPSDTAAPTAATPAPSTASPTTAAPTAATSSTLSPEQIASVPALNALNTAPVKALTEISASTAIGVGTQTWPSYAGLPAVSITVSSAPVQQAASGGLAQSVTVPATVDRAAVLADPGGYKTGLAFMFASLLGVNYQQIYGMVIAFAGGVTVGRRADVLQDTANIGYSVCSSTDTTICTAAESGGDAFPSWALVVVIAVPVVGLLVIGGLVIFFCRGSSDGGDADEGKKEPYAGRGDAQLAAKPEAPEV